MTMLCPFDFIRFSRIVSAIVNFNARNKEPSNMSKDKLWGGRFTQPTDKFVEEFTASIDFDKRLYHQDIRGSVAHARMLGKQGIIPLEDVERIVHGLQR